MTAPRLVTRADILPMREYAPRRAALRRELSALRARRRVEVGPYMSFSFECYRTIWHQIHEMLFIEKGGEEQIAGELEAYNPLIPNGDELVATMMIEIDEPIRRDRALSKMGGIENAIAFQIGGIDVPAVPIDDADRTSADGKTSSVHFFRFPFSAAAKAAFTAPGAKAVLAITHPEYGHMAALSETARAELAGDFAA